MTTRSISLPASLPTNVTGSTANGLGSRQRLFLLSASTDETLKSRAEQLQIFLRENEQKDGDEWMKDLAYTLSKQATHPYRTVVISGSIPQLQDRLSLQLKIQQACKRPTIGFIFTGQGAHWTGMGKELLETYPVFRQSMERICLYMNRLGAPYNVIGLFFIRRGVTAAD